MRPTVPSAVTGGNAGVEGSTPAARRPGITTPSLRSTPAWTPGQRPRLTFLSATRCRCSGGCLGRCLGTPQTFLRANAPLAVRGPVSLGAGRMHAAAERRWGGWPRVLCGESAVVVAGAGVAWQLRSAFGCSVGASAGVAHAGRDAADRQQEAVLQLLVRLAAGRLGLAGPP